MSAPAEDFIHPTVAIVEEIHQEAIVRFGGSPGVRDLALLESAVATPQATMMGVPVFSDAVELAAAYLFYLCRNDPFIDGNKRAALGACLVFLRLNGLEPAPDGPEWEALVLAVASGELDRDETTARLRELVRTRRSRRPRR
ncbi:MAG: type II toxin-antitoxin system death-on-curing family toxin [Verrucomicrobia bacterium]|jgi:death-on-curing protein|nr:type II toxin-antitoxin system death-on-curing family toxin [Verrucomicrobiota bacterium]